MKRKTLTKKQKLQKILEEARPNRYRCHMIMCSEWAEPESRICPKCRELYFGEGGSQE